MSRDMTKPTKWVCALWRLRSACASAQSEQSSLCTQWVAKDPSFFHAETLIRLGRCPGWSESSLGAHAILLVLSCVAHFFFAPYVLKSTNNAQKWSKNKLKIHELKFKFYHCLVFSSVSETLWIRWFIFIPPRLSSWTQRRLTAAKKNRGL